MTGRRAVIGLALLCALVLGAVTAPNAGAAVANGTTAWTCTEEAKPNDKSVGFSDEHCTVAATGTNVKFVHKEIPETFPNFVSATNSSTTKSVPAKLKGTIGEVAWEVEALGYSTCEKGATLFNLTSFATKQMLANGRYCGEFSEVKVNKPANCSVEKNKIGTLVGALWTTKVEINKAGEEQMWVEFEAEPPGKLVIAKFELLGAACALKNKVVEVTGSAKANVQNEKGGLLGSTLNFTTKTTGETLKANGAKAEFEGEFTPRMAEEENTDPIALTTKKEP
jgi:hypothetical protein